ncbi:MAG TPA: pyridoxamine 5'-phosphate oxidase family protein [Acidimicrobiales bacterium]|nr:pyridoxamine 5'-phosphate oxidase family protein [Acidimicrobiales bacterium]
MELEPDGEVTAAECRQLIASESVGRLALCVHALPVILPVQYYVDGDAIAICLGHHEVPPSSIDGTVVAFAVDSMAPDRVSGWSVHCTGTLALPAAAGGALDCGQPTAGQVIRFEPVVVTGERLRLCPFLTF